MKRALLKNYYGYDSFRPGQEELIDAVLAGRDVLGIMPTGGGKSLCYQIPALMLEGITLVISPLISLMQDQVAALRQAGIGAAYINSSLTREQVQTVYARLKQGRYKIVYVAPERLETAEFLQTAKRLSISLLAVDEAHCVSQWGNDFRPAYLSIPSFVAELSVRPPIAAYTATATELVRADVAEKLGLRTPLRVVTGFDRPNLHFEVRQTSKKSEELLKILSAARGKSGIVYCMTRKAVEKVHELLLREGFAATRYHAGLDEEERRRNQQAFVYDEAPVIVATNAFGMGIDKSNVSFVIHYNMPLSPEAYYQEAGRAGRDGTDADCILLYSSSDVRTARLLLEHSEYSGQDGALQQRQDLDRLERMIAYCKTTSCLRGYILDYFGQSHQPFCGNCGNCAAPFVLKDVTVEAQKIFSCVKRIENKLGFSVGAAMVVRVLRGSADKRIKEWALDGLSTYGILKEMTRQELNDMITGLTEQGYMEQDERGAIGLTPRANEVLFRGERAVVSVKQEPKKKEKSKRSSRLENGRTEEESALYEHLRTVRYRLACKQNVPAYVIFSNATLQDMARKCPVTSEEFLHVSGVGQTKAGLYGAVFLREIRAFLGED